MSRREFSLDKDNPQPGEWQKARFVGLEKAVSLLASASSFILIAVEDNKLNAVSFIGRKDAIKPLAEELNDMSKSLLRRENEQA